MNTISKKKLSYLAVFAMALLSIGFVGCDFQGPWEYYPEEREIYRGVYTYGNIIRGDAPRICFSKLYALDETAAESFAFYDSASVKVWGIFGGKSAEDSVELQASKDDPNCFEVDSTMRDNYLGVAGNAYKMRAFLTWDSSGNIVKSEYMATAKIPMDFQVPHILIPRVKGKDVLVENKHQSIETYGLEYPYDMSLYKMAPHFGNDVGGILVTMEYDNVNGGETMNSLLNNMMGGMIDKDSLGYGGLSTKEPSKNTASAGYYANMKIGSVNNADTIFMPSMSIPVGKVVFYFYATDYAYQSYETKVLESMSDPRVLPESNVQNGMGVFSGMIADSLVLNVKLENFVTYEHMQIYDCVNGSGGGAAWDSKNCRLKQDEFCFDDSIPNTQYKWCYAPLVKFAMGKNEKWTTYLPEKISDADKSKAYADGLKRFCVENDFKSNDIADCSEMQEQCQISTAKNSCKEYIWNFCADRDWNLEKFPQCGNALVSRFYLEKVKSPVLQKVVEKWCRENPKDTQCQS